MESLFILIPIALIFLTLVVLIFFWAVKSGQFEDFDTEARRILFDDDTHVKQSSQPLDASVREKTE